MARRKRVKPTDPKVFFGLLVAVGIIWVIVQVLQQVSRISSGEIGLVILIGGAAALAFPVVRHLRRAASRRALYQKSQAIVAQHIGALVTRRAQLVTPDAYGKPQFEKWEKEIGHFIAQIVGPSLTPNEQTELHREGSTFVYKIDAIVAAAMLNQPVFQAFSDSMTPIQFEHFCANELRQVGWNAHVTKQSGDQGVDVVAEMDHLRVVIQCKLYYGQPVGNKAVQEAVAGRGHERATHSAVVTNNEYTLAAKQLASTNGIFLLHYSQLRNLHDLLYQRPV
ncbi:MAG: restriction endonuclease [Terracidiphilus sp.]|nr:restriction endonuclease [Terracidiphilus sp.]MDR3799697.1 restriction endonuclease [Terracidiphilus sp.]